MRDVLHEEAEMPSSSTAASSSSDGLFYCQKSPGGSSLRRNCDLAPMRTQAPQGKCTECPYVGADLRDVRRHMFAAHKVSAKARFGEQPSITCSCGAEFTRKDNAQRHCKRNQNICTLQCS